MTHQLTVKGALDPEDVRRWLERPLARLRRKLARFPADAVHLRTVVRETEDRRRAEASVALELPSRTLAASEEGAVAQTALKRAFEELARLLEKEKARLRRADGWRRSREAFRQELLERVARQEPGDLAASASEALGRLLREVETFARRELRWLELSGELVPGEVDLGDVVDGAFARAFARMPRPDRRLLLQCAAAALRSELTRARRARAHVRIEEDIPERAPEEAVATLGSERLDFRQPDEDLSREAILAGLGHTPEEIEAGAEVLEVLRRALAALPPSWRQALHLQEIERLDPIAIAEALEVEEGAVPELLARARAFLRQRLREAGVLEATPAGGRRPSPHDGEGQIAPPAWAR